jgi:predicted small lipoprotein YifL
MFLRSLFVVLLGLAVSSCGIKSDLLMPDGKATPKSQRDPSRPPQPIGK